MRVCVRPERVQLGGGEVRTDGVVRLVEYLGAYTLAYLDLPSGQSLLMHGGGAERHRHGDRVTGFDTTDLRFFDAEGERVERLPALAA